MLKKRPFFSITDKHDDGIQFSTFRKNSINSSKNAAHKRTHSRVSPKFTSIARRKDADSPRCVNVRRQRAGENRFPRARKIRFSTRPTPRNSYRNATIFQQICDENFLSSDSQERGGDREPRGFSKGEHPPRGRRVRRRRFRGDFCGG